MGNPITPTLEQQPRSTPALPGGNAREDKAVAMVVAMIESNKKLQDEIVSYKNAMKDSAAEPAGPDSATLKQKEQRSLDNLRDGIKLEFPAIKHEYVDAVVRQIHDKADPKKEKTATTDKAIPPMSIKPTPTPAPKAVPPGTPAPPAGQGVS